MAKMKRPKVRDNLTAERLLEEMNSQLFVNTLRQALEHAKKTGYETRFDLTRSPSQDEFFYPEHIAVGDGHSVYGLYDIVQSREPELLEKFIEQYGEFPRWVKPEKCKDKKEWETYQEYREKFDAHYQEFEKFIAEKGQQIRVPVIGLPDNRTHLYSGHFNDVYEKLGMHTHPSQDSWFFGFLNVIPSKNDLISLIKCKRRNGDTAVCRYDSEPIILGNPLSLIVADHGVPDGHPVSLTSCMSGRKITKNQMAENMNLIADNLAKNVIVGDYFAFTKGYFDPNTGRFSLREDCIDALLEDYGK